MSDGIGITLVKCYRVIWESRGNNRCIQGFIFHIVHKTIEAFEV